MKDGISGSERPFWACALKPAFLYFEKGRFSFGAANEPCRFSTLIPWLKVIDSGTSEAYDADKPTPIYGTPVPHGNQ